MKQKLILINKNMDFWIFFLLQTLRQAFKEKLDRIKILKHLSFSFIFQAFQDHQELERVPLLRHLESF